MDNERYDFAIPTREGLKSRERLPTVGSVKTFLLKGSIHLAV